MIWGIKLWAPFQPHWDKDLCQNACNCSRNGPVGHAYKMYSRGQLSSKVGSFTCANNQSDASITPLFPVAAKAFSLKQISFVIPMEVILLFRALLNKTRRVNFMFQAAKITDTRQNREFKRRLYLYSCTPVTTYTKPSLKSACLAKRNYT